MGERAAEQEHQDVSDGLGPPYRLTALILLGSIAVSQVVPWAKRDIAGNVPPLLAQVHFSVGPWLPIALAAVVGALVLLPRSLGWPRWLFLSTAVATGWVVSITLAAEAHGMSAVTAPFQRPLEYYTSVPLVRSLGARTFAVQYPHLGGQLALHARTHGPGSVLFLWALSRLTGGSVVGVSVLVAFVGLLGAIPTYAIGRALADERAARLAALLFVCSPGVLIYSSTSMDAVFMTVIAVALAALVRFPSSSSLAFVAGFLWALALSFTFGALVLALFATGVALAAATGSDGDRPRPARTLSLRAVLVLAGLIVGYLGLRLGTGIDLLADFQAAWHANSHDPSRARPYLYWVVANLPAFLFSAGIAQTALLAYRTRRQWREPRFGFETVFWSSLALSSLSGVFLGEVDHIWLFFIPPLAAIAGAGLQQATENAHLPLPESKARIDPVGRVLAGSLGQAGLVQLLLYTYW